MRVRKTPRRTIAFHDFYCCESVQSQGFSAFVGASHRSLARAGDRWLVQTNGRTAFVGGAEESDLPTQMPDGPRFPATTADATGRDPTEAAKAKS